MIDNKKIESDIWSLYNELRGAFFHKNIGFSVIRLIFIKYAADNCLGAYTREEMQDYSRLQRVFAARDVGAGPNGLVPILSLIDREYNLNGLMHKSINDYARELFGLDDSWNRKNASDRNFERIMSILSTMDLIDDPATFEKGKVIVDALTYNLYTHGATDKSSAVYYSSRELNAIVSKLLDVQEGETYLDFASGIGTSTLSIVGNGTSPIIHCDVYEEILPVSAMLLIMSGHHNFKLINKDCFDYEGYPIDEMDVVGSPVIDNDGTGLMADKIFVDPPLGMKCRGNALRDSHYVAVQKALASLKEGGKAVVAVPASALFTASKKAKLFKEYIFGNGYVESVITLPMTWSGTTVTINLLVLSKKKTYDVFFFNGISEECKRLVETNKTRSAMQISEQGLEWICGVIVNRDTIEGVSRAVNYQEIVSNEYDVIPTRYVQEKIIGDSTTVEEIDAELKALYEKLIPLV